MNLKFFGGALLILGFLTRLASAFVAIFMVANIIMKKKDEGRVRIFG